MTDQKREKPALRTTKDYSIFVLSAKNRPTDLDLHRKLFSSMQEHGFLEAFPMYCVRTTSGKLEIQDGQHRFATAQKLGLPVWFVVMNERVNIAEINNTQKTWSLEDYARSFANQGKSDYQELLSFVESHRIPFGMASALLEGTVSGCHRRDAFFSGGFKVKARERAAAVASLYRHLTSLNKSIKNARLLGAVYAVCHVPGFEPHRIVEGANSAPELLVSYSTQDAYLGMLEELYNFRRRHRQPLKIPAENAMRERNPGLRKSTPTPETTHA